MIFQNRARENTITGLIIVFYLRGTRRLGKTGSWHAAKTDSSTILHRGITFMTCTGTGTRVDGSG